MRDTNPQESLAIRKQIEQMEKLLAKLKGEAQEKRNQVQKAKDKKIFLQESHRQMLWVQDMKETLKSKEMGTDVASAEQLLRDHQYLLREIQGQKDRWGMYIYFFHFFFSLFFYKECNIPTV